MQIAFHIGANCTDEDRLLKSVLQNADALHQLGVSVPGPSRYRKLIREAIQALDGAPPAAGARDVLLDAILDEEKPDRMVLANDNFIAIPPRIFDHGVFYPQAEAKVAGLCQLFPEDEISLFMGLRHPAAFLQDVFRRSEAGSLEAYLGVIDPADLRWSDVIRRVKRAAPTCTLYVWCNEETPLIWEQLIRLFSGIDPSQQVAGRFDVVARLVDREALRDFRAKVDAETPSDGPERQALIADFLEAHLDPESAEDEINLPGMDAELIDRMTDAYFADLDMIEAMAGVTLIRPFA